MTRDDIIRMAEQAGAHHLANVPGFTEFLARFANLVAADRKEACAKVAEELYYLGPASSDIADAIRTMDKPDDL
jgi:hypothetical protein